MANHVENEKLLRRYYKAANEKDFEAIWSCFAPDVVYTDATVGHTCKGLDAFKNFYLEYMLALDVKMEFDSIVTTDTAYGLSNHFFGKHAADLPGLPATGKSFRMPSASIGTIKNGQIKTNTDYWNQVDLMKQLGLMS
jgi:steroid delta-isomerase-like uncharacterized protein